MTANWTESKSPSFPKWRTTSVKGTSLMCERKHRSRKILGQVNRTLNVHLQSFAEDSWSSQQNTEYTHHQHNRKGSNNSYIVSIHQGRSEGNKHFQIFTVNWSGGGEKRRRVGGWGWWCGGGGREGGREGGKWRGGRGGGGEGTVVVVVVVVVVKTH